MKKKFKRSGDDLISILISMAITGITIVSATMVMMNSYVFMGALSKTSSESQDIRNVSGIINRYSDISSSVTYSSGSIGQDIIFNDKVKISTTGSGCENMSGTGARFIYYPDYQNSSYIIGLTSCYNDITTSVSSIYNGLELKIFRYKIKIGNNSYYNTISAKL